MSELLLQATGLVAGYNGSTVLTGIDLTVRAGERVAITGPNGVGKTTLLRVLIGELPPKTGTVIVKVPCALVEQGDRGRLDYPVSAFDVALMGALANRRWWRPLGRSERRRAQAAIEAVGLSNQARTLYGRLSGGQRQRARIARALVQRARLLLLDEPFTGLDTAGSATLDALLDRLTASGHGVVLVTHDEEQAGRCQQRLVLKPVSIDAPIVT